MSRENLVPGDLVDRLTDRIEELELELAASRLHVCCVPVPEEESVPTDTQLIDWVNRYPGMWPSVMRSLMRRYSDHDDFREALLAMYSQAVIDA